MMGVQTHEPVGHDRPQDVSRLTGRIARLLEALSAGLVEREQALKLVLLAALAGEHALLVGPPGTAKSEVARRVCTAFSDSTFFERLLTRFTVPEELFGPLSLKALERDEYWRLTKGYLPSASIAFLDEIFKANSAILNALLGLLNERHFDNGTERVRVPLISAVGASNELPKGTELAALHDRFLVRCYVDPVSVGRFAELLQAGDAPTPRIAEGDRLTLADLARIQMGARGVGVSGGVEHALTLMKSWLADKKLYVSDRRWVKIVGLLRVAAFTEGRDMVLLPDLELVQHCVWNKPEQAAAVRDWYEAQMTDLTAQEATRYLRIAESYHRFIGELQNATRQRKDASGRPLYHDEKGGLTTEREGRRPRCDRQGDPLFLPPGGKDRRGLTMEELFNQHFSAETLEEFELYITDRDNAVYDSFERQPAVERLPVAERAVADRRTQIDRVARDLVAFARAFDGEFERQGGRLWSPGANWHAFYDRVVGSRHVLTEAAKRVHAVRSRLNELTDG